jgi:hypothetical protein
MMHSNLFRVVGAILVVLAILAFLLRGTFGAPAAPSKSAVAPTSQAPTSGN